MKRSTTLLTLLLTALVAYWSIKSAMPDYQPDTDKPIGEFSVDRALAHVKNIAEKPHAVGFEAHAEVRTYIVSELEKMGLTIELQEGYTVGDWANYSKAINIISRIEGSGEGPALLLLSHYDSNPHSALGASDAGSGVATILEGIRAFLASDKQPANDIIILISDAEELGLNGADLFVNKHPWARDVGLVLNFEARGSGGPSFMLLETNGGNRALIEAFDAANPSFPVGNSLAYSIYKMLPNDTDLTVFREDGDINGFNFAFIDDHFDYHTVRDNYARLDRNSLAHQGSYLTELLGYFAQQDLSALQSESDLVYFSVPLFKLVTYPFAWGWYLVGGAWFLFAFLLYRGIRRDEIVPRQMALGFIPMVLVLVINGLLGYYGWDLIKLVYPHYKDILHGFTYNGHAYIMAFAFLALGICFIVYHRFKSASPAALIGAPLFIWLVICTLLTQYLPGAGFMIVPVFVFLLALQVLVNQKNPNAYLLWFLGLPALVLFVPFIQMFAVGLGLRMMITVTLLTTLTLFLLLPLMSHYKSKRKLGSVFILLCLFFLILAHTRSGFNEDRAKPSSLLYVLDAEEEDAFWATYEREPSSWTTSFVGKADQKAASLSKRVISSKYRTPFRYVKEAPLKKILAPGVEIQEDTLLGENRSVRICIRPNRPVNRLDVFTDATFFSEAIINSIPLKEAFLKRRKGGKLVTHYVSDNDNTEIYLTFPKDSTFSLMLYESSNDLLNHEAFTIPQRPPDNIAMPFVLNDAIMTISSCKIE